MRLRDAAAPIAERQLGLVTRVQLIHAGVSVAAIDHALRTARLVAMRPGVYRVPGVPVTGPARMLADALFAGPGSAYSHRSAAWLWHLLDDAPRIHELSVVRHRRVRLPDLIVHESSDLDLAVRGTIDGVPVTGVGRTILDCAADPTADLDLLIDAARRIHGISRTLLPWTLIQHARSGRRGICRLREHLELDDLPHSEFERLFTRWLRAHSVAGWHLHHRIVVGDRPIEIDIAWPDRLVAVELEGADHRDRRIVHDDDTARQNALVLGGWTVVRVTYRRWLAEPDAVLAEILGALNGA